MKDLDVLLADEAMVLILDDTEHVWEKHRANLIQVGGQGTGARTAGCLRPWQDATSMLLLLLC